MNRGRWALFCASSLSTVYTVKNNNHRLSKLCVLNRRLHLSRSTNIGITVINTTASRIAKEFNNRSTSIASDGPPVGLHTYYIISKHLWAMHAITIWNRHCVLTEWCSMRYPVCSEFPAQVNRSAARWIIYTANCISSGGGRGMYPWCSYVGM